MSLSASVSVGVTSNTGQSFSTQPVTNNGLALYTLSIRAPNSGALVAEYTFPISPSAITKEFTGMSNVFDVAGAPSQSGSNGQGGQYGVQRLIDFYGNSPVTYTIEGTTGWQRHSTDGFAFTGLESIMYLQEILNLFAQYNAQQAQNNNPNLYTLEFYDYFASDFWQVVPVGKQGIRQDQSQPLIFKYSFKLVAIQAVSDAPAPSPDALLSQFSLSSIQVQGSLITGISSFIENYSGTAGISVGVSF